MASVLEIPSGADELKETDELLLRRLAAKPEGLSQREAERRLAAYGPNELVRRGGRRWPRQVAKQLTHPLALLLWLAAALAFVGGTPVLGGAILAVIALNAVFAQEQQAERAFEALRTHLPQQALVLRDGHRQTIDATTLVPGDVLLLAEGDRISADGRLLKSALKVDMSTVTGESKPVYRAAELRDTTGPVTEARNLVCSSGPGSTWGSSRPRSSSRASSSCCCRASWEAGADVGTGAPLHHVYLQATTMTFAGIVACQIGTAVAARTERASLRAVGFFTNRLLLCGIASELVFLGLLIYVPVLQAVFGTPGSAPPR